MHPARIAARVGDELPFMATEELIVRAVRAGASRQDAHEVIRRHSIAAARSMKDEGRPNDMLERLAADPEFGVPLDDLHATLDAERFVGRAPQQVDEFLAEVVAPILAGVRRARRARGGARMTLAHLDHRPPAPACIGAARCAMSTSSVADRLLLVATDRVSAFDVVMHETVPFKGIVLTQMTAWWLRQLQPIVAHHMLGTAVEPLVEEFPALAPHRELLRGRMMVSPAHVGLSGRVRDARLHLRLGVEGVPRHRDARRRSAPARARARATGCSRRSSRPATKAEIGARREHHDRRR